MKNSRLGLFTVFILFNFKFFIQEEEKGKEKKNFFPVAEIIFFEFSEDEISCQEHDSCLSKHENFTFGRFNKKKGERILLSLHYTFNRTHPKNSISPGH